jgi:hypothetical protein
MPTPNGDLYIFEAIELRNEYDRQIWLIEKLIEEEHAQRDRFYGREEEEKEPVSEFSPREFEEKLKKIQTKRVKLNQAIQVANFNYQIEFNGEKISIAEALEIRKNLFADLEAIAERVKTSAYKRIIHKEERDIVHEPRQPFRETYEEYQENLKKLRDLITKIHIANHKNSVNFKDE